MPKLLLIRHCQSTGRHPDSPLSDAGAKAAQALIIRLRDLAPDAVYSSPYERAHATVRPFAISAGLSVGLDDRLRERVLSDRDLEDRLDHVRRSFAEPDYRAPGGESLNQTKQRAIAALTDIAAAGHRLPAVSSHRSLIASVLRSMDTAFGFEQWQDLYPRPVRSRTRRRSADQVRATGRPTALRGAVTRPSPDGYDSGAISRSWRPNETIGVCDDAGAFIAQRTALRIIPVSIVEVLTRKPEDVDLERLV